MRIWRVWWGRAFSSETPQPARAAKLNRAGCGLFSCGVDDLRRLPFRLLPTIETIANIEQVCEYLDMPSYERPPKQCSNRHPFGPNTCLVGWEVCACTTAHNGGHRTHYCRQCGETVRTPPCAGAKPQTDRWTNKPARVPPPPADNDYPHL